MQSTQNSGVSGGIRTSNSQCHPPSSLSYIRSWVTFSAHCSLMPRSHQGTPSGWPGTPVFDFFWDGAIEHRFRHTVTTRSETLQTTNYHATSYCFLRLGSVQGRGVAGQWGAARDPDPGGVRLPTTPGPETESPIDVSSIRKFENIFCFFLLIHTF